MSRIGKQPVKVPSDVKVSISGNTVNIDGPKGKLSQTFHPDIAIEYIQQDKQIVVKRSSDEKHHRALHGLTRSLISNMVLLLGYTHPVSLVIPNGIKVEVTNPTNPAKFTVSGPDKQMVGQFSAVIRSKRPPEPYKGMGVKYEDEVIRRKAGKATSSGTA